MRMIKKGALSMALLASCAAYSKVDDSRVLTEASALAIEMTTNYASSVRMMTSDALKDWKHIWEGTKTGGKQYFMPDFCRVKYTIVAGVDERGFLMGMYNPFYDAFMLLLVDNAERTRISGVKVLSGRQVTSRKNISGVPPAHGITPCDRYFPALLQQVALAVDAFGRMFKEGDFRATFTGLPAFPPDEKDELLDLVRARTVKATDMVRRKDVLASAALARLAVRGSVPDESKIMSKDEATTTVSTTLDKNLSHLRANLEIVSWFADGDLRNFLFSSPSIPTFMVQVVVGGDSTVKMQMFDANIAISAFKSSK